MKYSNRFSRRLSCLYVGAHPRNGVVKILVVPQREPARSLHPLVFANFCFPDSHLAGITIGVSTAIAILLQRLG